MKQKIITLSTFILFIALVGNGCKKEKVEQICFIEHTADAYDYPVKPGTPEWEQITSNDEMDSVLKIPDDLLYSISTEGLIETALNFPRFGDIYFLEDYQLAFDRLKEQFNGFQELLKRDDAAIKLFDRYLQMHPECKTNNWPSIVEPGRSASFSFAYIEIIIAQYDILNQFDKKEIETLLKEVIIKYEGKNKCDYSVFSKKHTVLIAGRIMYLSHYEPFMEEYNSNFYVNEFVDKVKLNNNFETLDLVYDYAKNFQIKISKK